jgi:hypothetical protein
MEGSRRRLLIDAAATANRSHPGISPRLAVSYEDRGQAIASDFIGLSYESAILAGGDYFTPDNVSALGLIRSLGEKGVIRIGGNTSERTVWVADVNHADPASFVITPANIDRLAAALHGLGWKLIYGLNLARSAPAEAAEEAAYVANAVGQICWLFRSVMSQTALVVGLQLGPPATMSPRIWPNGTPSKQRYVRECRALRLPDPTFPARLIGLPHSRRQYQRDWYC